MRYWLFVFLVSLSYGQIKITSGTSLTPNVSMGKGGSNPKQLVSLAVTPTNAQTTIGGTVNYTATGTFSDSSTQNLTASSVWASSNTSVAIIGASGNPQPVTGVSSGLTFIDATTQGITSNDVPLQVNPQALAITTTNCPLATQNIAYTCTVVATGGNPAYTFSISVGTLPAGLTITSSTGVISGTPTVVGTSTFTVQVTDTSVPMQTATQVLSITVASSGGVTDENFYDNVNGTCQNMGTQDGPANLPSKCYNTAVINTPSPGGFFCVAPNGQTLPATCTGSVANYTSIASAFSFISSSCSPASATCIPCGSTIKIVATNTGTPSGTQNIYDETNLTYPAVTCNNSNWITVETDMIASLPGEQSRISPAWTNIPSLSGRPSYAQPTTVGNYIPMIRNTGFSQPIFRIASTTTTTGAIAAFARFIGLEIAQPGPGTSQCTGKPCQNQWNNFLITTGCDPASSSKICPDHIIFDRVIADPDAHTGIDTTTVCFGIGGSATNFALINSYFYGIKIPLNAKGTCEAKTIGMGNNTAGGTQGPYKFINNFLEGSAENTFFGGGFSVNDATNVEYRRNHLFKPFNLWMPGKPGYLGGLMFVKNLYESKAIAQALIEGNVMEYDWYGHGPPPQNQPLTDQFGSGVLLHAAQGTTTQTHQSIGQDVTYRYNWVRHTVRAVDMDVADCTTSKLQGCGTNFPPGDVTPLIQRESIHDNLWDDISTKWFTNPYGGIGSFDGTDTIFANGITGVGIYGSINTVTFNHNTIITSSYSQDVTVTSISINGTGTATLTYSGTTPRTPTANDKIQIFGSCANFNEYATIIAASPGQFTYASGAPINTTCNSGFVSQLHPIVGGATHLNEAASNDFITNVVENGTLAGLTVNPTRNKPTLFNIMCTSVNPPTACKPGQVTTFTVWGLTGTLSCYNNNAPNCGSGGTTTTPATWILAGRVRCLFQPTTITIASGGTGYAVNDLVKVNAGNGDEQLTITSIGTGGVVTGFSVNTKGTGYSVANGISTTEISPGNNLPPGVGTGFTVNITVVNPGTVIGAGDNTPCTSPSITGRWIFWFNHIQSGLPAAGGIGGAFFSYWASLNQPNYGPDPNPGWLGITVTNNILAGKITQEQGNCQPNGNNTTSRDALNTCGVVATTGPGAVNYTCNIIVSHAAIAQLSTTDILPAGNVDSPDTTMVGIGFTNFNYDNLGKSVDNLNDLSIASNSQFITGVSATGCTSDGLPTGANIGLIQTYTAGVL